MLNLLRIYITILSILFLTLAGCADEQTSAPTVVNPGKKVKPAEVAPKQDISDVEEVKEVEFVYNPSGKRDPFVPLFTVRRPVPEEEVPLTPLQQFDLSQFRLIGVIVGKGDPRAMVEAPGGKPYLVGKGMKIGKNNGVVTKIDSKEVEVKESYFDFSGTMRTAINKIEFPPRQGVSEP